MKSPAATSTGSAGFAKGASAGKSDVVGKPERSSQNVTSQRGAYKPKTHTHFGPKPAAIKASTSAKSE